MLNVRILFVTPYFYPAESFGGPVKVAFDVGKELVKRGHEVTVFTSDARDSEHKINVESDDVRGMRVYYFRNLSMLLVRFSKLFITPELPKKMGSDLKSFDIIHAHEYTTYQNAIVHKFAEKYGVPYVLQAHGSLPKVGRRARKWLYDALFGSRLLRDASKVIALNQMEADRYRRIGVPNERIATIPNGIDLSEYSDLPPKGFFKKKFGLGNEKRIILYIGRIHKTKGITLLIKAYAHLVKSLGFKDTILVIAGPDDGYLHEVMSLTDFLGISDSVLFTGFVSDEDKLKALVDAHVFVTPCFYGFPITFLEACVAGTPIITTTLGDYLEWIDNHVGYVTLPNILAIAEAMHEIVCDDDLRERLSRNCRNIVKSEFSVQRVVDRLEHVYRQAAGNRCK